MQNEQKNKQQIILIISQLAYKCHQATQDGDNQLLQDTLSQLQSEMATLEIKDQYEMMVHLQSPNNVNGEFPAVEYNYVKTCFMNNLANYYSINITFQDEFIKQVSVFSPDQLLSLKTALEQAQANEFPANQNLNQDGKNTQSRRFFEYIRHIDDVLVKKELNEQEMGE